MNYKLQDIHKDIEKQRAELEAAIINNEGESTIYSKSTKLDETIAKYYNAKTYYNEKNRELNTKYSLLIEKEYKDEILNLIRNDVKKIFQIENEEELEHLSSNLYVMCSLKANNIPEQEITDQIIYGDNIFLNELKEKGIVLNSNDKHIPLEEHIRLVKKYVEIIKERM